MQLANPQLTRWIRTDCCHPMLARHVERVVMLSFPLLYIPPLFQTFYHSFFIPLNCYLVGHANHSPSLARQKRAPTAIPWTGVAWRMQWLWVLLSLIFPPYLTLFAQLLFPIQLLSHWLCEMPSLSQSREQGPGTTISAQEWHREGGDGKFPACF